MVDGGRLGDDRWRDGWRRDGEGMTEGWRNGERMDER